MPIYWNTNDENVQVYDYIYGARVLRKPDSENSVEPDEPEQNDHSASDYGQWSDDE